MRNQRITLFRWLFLLWIVWLPVVWAGTGWQSLPESIRKSQHDPRQYQAIKLDNGMTVLLVSDKEASKSLAAIAIPIGSLDDPDSQLGLAHYLEHMVLMGSKRYPQPDSFSLFLKQHGGSYNASTAPYRTAFYMEVENSALAGAVDRLADALAEPLLGVVNADRERNAVNAEMTMARSRDGQRMAQVSAETLNPQHPAARFSGGNLETLSDKPKSRLHDALVNFYQKYYSANLMVGVIYGNNSFAELSQMAVNSFGRIANRHSAVPVITVPTVTDKQKGLIIHYVPAQPQRTLNIEFRIDNNSQAFRSKTDTYISYLLGNRSHNTLADWLQKQGLADGVNAGADPMQNRNGGVFVISISLTDKGMQERDRVIGTVFNYIELLRTQGVDPRYFDEIAKVLALDFRYPSVTRDMNYIEWLADMMIRVPYQHVLDAPYLADQYDPAAIRQRLQQMTPEQARIWFISPNEPHNKVAYFVNAPYEVDKISQKRFALWRQLAQQEVLNLPKLNPYIPTEFSLISSPEGIEKPKVLQDKPNLRVYYMPSRYFADEPKANVEFALRTPFAQQDARQQVEFALLDYMAGVALDQLSYQASVRGISFSTSASNGLKFSATGFTQHLPTLLSAMIDGYRHFMPTEQQLQQAKSWYREKLDAAEKGKAFEQAMNPLQSLSFVPYTERQVRREQLAKITLKDLLDYRARLFQQATPELLVVGNMSASQVNALAETLTQRSGAMGQQIWSGQNVVVKSAFDGTFYQRGSSTDAALAALYLPTGYSEIESMAYSTLLEQVAQPLFYDQLRSKEQLGYAVFAFSANVGRQWGICFLLQSSNRSPAYLYQRYQAFYPMLEQQLQEMDAAKFIRYKEALITQLQERPQTLDEEVQRLQVDFTRGNKLFDHRAKLIEQIGKIDQAGLLRFYQAAVLKQQGLALLSQVIGHKASQSGYITPAGWYQVPNASTLQQRLPIEVVH